MGNRQQLGLGAYVEPGEYGDAERVSHGVRPEPVGSAVKSGLSTSAIYFYPLPLPGLLGRRRLEPLAYQL